MQLSINGEQRTEEDGISLAHLLERLELAPLRVAVEVNRRLVPRADYRTTSLRDADNVEIVTFVGGG